MCDCFHLAFPNWHAASSGTGVKQTTAAGAGRRLRAPEPNTEDDSICDEPSQFTEGERPRPQGSSPVEEFPETGKYTDSDKECEAEHDPHHKSGSGKKSKKSGLGSMFEKRSTPKMSKLKEVHSPESGVIVKTAKDGCAEGLVYGGGGKDGIFIKEVVPESPASKSLKLKEGDQILSATVYFDNVSYEDAIQILEHAQAYKVKLCLKRKPDITETEAAIESDVIPEDDLYAPEMREKGKTKRRGDARISWPKFPSFGKGRKSRFTRSHSSSEADEQRKLELSPTTSDTESPIKSQDAVKDKKKHKLKLSMLTKRGRISST
ncbi:Protein AHNAK2 [Larimichthys crocea]|uniref:Protein AHNAK2 n=1 Tax=Larimichthys crocea TaxID=215358 RepID=A0A6G0IG80_LARCR|nr:Protein AHNAK2 [Larimichthys crocea]